MDYFQKNLVYRRHLLPNVYVCVCVREKRMVKHLYYVNPIIHKIRRSLFKQLVFWSL